MEKAYDVNVLLEKLKDLGLDIAEDTANELLTILIEWLKESAKLSATPYDDMALIILPQLENFLKSAIDKIDGEEG